MTVLDEAVSLDSDSMPSVCARAVIAMAVFWTSNTSYTSDPLGVSSRNS